MVSFVCGFRSSYFQAVMQVDILIKDKEIQLSIFVPKEDSETASESADLCIEGKTNHMFTSTALQQMMAHTIVFTS